MPYSRPRIASEADVAPPRKLEFSDLGDVVSLGKLCEVTGLDKKTILVAIHAGKLPAWFPGGNPQIGFRMHRRDAEAWFFSDPSRAYTPGVGTPEGPAPR